MPKKMITVPVTDGPPTRQKYSNGGSEFLYYGYSPSLHAEDTVSSLLKELNDIKKDYGGRYQNLKFVEKRDCGCYHDCSCSREAIDDRYS